MTTPPEPDDALLQSLIEETKGLPQAAAAQARAHRQAQTNTVRTAAVGLVLLSITGIWLADPPAQTDIRNTAGGLGQPAHAPANQGYVRIHAAGEAPTTDAIPLDATGREKELMTALPGVPLLIVKNEAGEVARVHIFER